MRLRSTKRPRPEYISSSVVLRGNGRDPFFRQVSPGGRCGTSQLTRPGISGRPRRPSLGDPFSGKSRVWTLSTLSSSYWSIQAPDGPVFRMFARTPSVFKAWNAVRVPPRAQHLPSSEGFLLQRVDIACGDVPLTLSWRAVAWLPRSLFKCVGWRVRVPG